MKPTLHVGEIEQRRNENGQQLENEHSPMAETVLLGRLERKLNKIRQRLPVDICRVSAVVVDPNFVSALQVAWANRLRRSSNQKYFARYLLESPRLTFRLGGTQKT